MSLFSGLEHILRADEPLARHTWFRLGGAAQYFAEPTTADELSTLVQRCRDGGLAVRLLGGGSNVLVRDQGIEGVVVHLGAPCFGNISVDGNVVKAGGGSSLAHVISSAAREGLGGLEPLVGIPGTVGGALHGNSGRQHADIGQVTCAATTMSRTGEIVRRTREDLQFEYRQSSLNELVILDAEFQLEPEDSVELTKRMQKLWIIAKSRQPTVDQYSGRMFKNPHGVRAADLIEQIGLKNSRLGPVEVSDRNANFIIAHPGASSEDVLRLADQIRSQVEEDLGVELENDIEVW